MVLVFVPVATSQLMDFGNRWEGRQTADNGKFDFLLLGLHRSFEPFREHAILKVRFAVPPGGTQPLVTASELNDFLDYAMVSTHLNHGEFYELDPWATSDVIDGHVDWNNLGVVASYVRGEDRFYSPADVGQSLNSPSNIYRVHFRLGASIQKLEIGVTSRSGTVIPVKVEPRKLSCDTSQVPNCTFWFDGDSHFVDLDFSAVPPGEYYVKLKGAIYKNPDNSPKLTFPLYHSPARR
jgi:hypothetical protein